MQVGDEAYVVGNPFGLYSSMSAGHLRLQPFLPTRLQQTSDQRFDPNRRGGNPGNSEGRCLIATARVIGIVTGIVNPTDQNFFIGIGLPCQSLGRRRPRIATLLGIDCQGIIYHNPWLHLPTLEEPVEY